MKNKNIGLIVNQKNYASVISELYRRKKNWLGESEFSTLLNFREAFTVNDINVFVYFCPNYSNYSKTRFRTAALDSHTYDSSIVCNSVSHVIKLVEKYF
jgi:hypothetical protein